MRCPFSSINSIVVALLLAQALSGCISLQIEKRQEGGDVHPPPVEYLQKTTLLKEILSSHGAPTDIADLNGDFALYYRKAIYRGMNVSIGIPLQNLLLNPGMEAFGDLLRYDTVVYIFTADGVMKDMKYEKGTSRSLWKDYWH